MAQLFFKYSTMNAGKSIELIKVAHNYEERGKTHELSDLVKRRSRSSSSNSMLR